MGEIIKEEAMCAECGKTLPQFSIAVVIQEDFIVCIECNKETEEVWECFLELQRDGRFYQDESDNEVR